MEVSCVEEPFSDRALLVRARDHRNMNTPVKKRHTSLISIVVPINLPQSTFLSSLLQTVELDGVKQVTVTLQGVEDGEQVQAGRGDRRVGGKGQAPSQAQHTTETQHSSEVLEEPGALLLVHEFPLSIAARRRPPVEARGGSPQVPQLQHHQAQHGAVKQEHRPQVGQHQAIEDHRLVPHPATTGQK